MKFTDSRFKLKVLYARTFIVIKLGRPSKISKEQLLQSASELMLLYGYHKTSIRTLMWSVGLGKGSFQNYFPTKKAMAFEVLDYHGFRELIELIDILDRSDISPLARIEWYFKQLSDYHTQTRKFKGGCLLGNFGQELADVSEPFRERIDTFFNIWIQRLAQCILEGQESHEINSSMSAHDLAELIIITWEGALLRTKIMKNAHPLKLFLTKFLGSLILPSDD